MARDASPGEKMDKAYRFTISDSYTLKTIPMERLAEYMAALARLLGEEASVHFDRLEEGSVALKARVDEPARPKVRERVHAIRAGSAPADARRAYAQIDDMLRRDNAYGALAGGEDSTVVPFPGKRKPEPIVYGPFRQHGTIDGEVYRIGGKDSSKHVHIHTGDRDLSVLYVNQAVALRLRHHLFGGPLRFRGEGSWVRYDDGTWELRSFRVDDFEELAEASLIETVARLRAVSGHEFGDDPVSDVLAERQTGEAA